MRRTPVVDACERARRSVVNISSVDKVRRWGRDLWGDIFVLPSENSVGSGVVLHENGYIATNAHVVAAGGELKVTFADGATYEARVIGRDNPRDLAVIKVEPREPLTPIALGRSDDLMIGEQTIAIGNPVGLHNTVTTGVISALHRDFEVASRVVYRDVIQTDASINPGNSGGALLNILGELIGINTAIRTDAQNIGFAIPVDQLREILPDILDGERINKVQIGLRVNGADAPRVQAVTEDSPAHAAGIREGDRILAVDGQALRRDVDYHIAMLEHQAGQTVRLTLQRGDAVPFDARLTLSPAPRPDGKRLALERLGLNVADVSENAARHFQWRRPGGVIVVGVEPDSPGQRAGIAPGDLLVSLGRYWLTDVDDLGTLLAEARSGQLVDIGFRRFASGRLYDGETRLYAR